MTNRTVQFWGQGYSTPPAEGVSLTPCTIKATVDGTVVFDGTIPTSESSDILRLPTDQQVLFSFQIPLISANVNPSNYTLPVSLEITGDDVFLEQIEANYSAIMSGTRLISSGPDVYTSISIGESRSNVVVTNATFTNAPPVPRPAGTEGTWGWEVETAPGQTSTMTFDMVVTPGLE